MAQPIALLLLAVAFLFVAIVRCDITGFPFSSGTAQCADYQADYPMQTTTYTSGTDVDACDSGTITTQARDDFLRVTNMFRRYAGLDPVQAISSEGETNATACALMCAANNRIQHGGWTASDDCYSVAGTYGCSSSNLALGVTAPNEIVRYLLWDGSDAGSGQGHRRWILNPSLGNTALGLVNSASSMYVFGHQSYTTSLGWYSWPPQGTTPYDAVYSPELTFHYARVNFTSEPIITNCQVCDHTGASVRVGGCWTDGPGYGDWGAIFIKTSLPGPGCYSVNLSYKTSSNGPEESVSYVSELYDCDTSGGGATCFGNGPVVCSIPSPASTLSSWADVL